MIDILKADPVFSKSSSQALQSKMNDVLMIAPITYVELAPAFAGNVVAQDGFLNALWIQCDFGGNRSAVLLLTSHGMNISSGSVQAQWRGVPLPM